MTACAREGCPNPVPADRRRYCSDGCLRRATVARAKGRRDRERRVAGRPAPTHVPKTVERGIERECDNPACAVRYVPDHHRQTYHAKWCRDVAANARREESPSARGTISRLRDELRRLRDDATTQAETLRAENRRLSELLAAGERELAGVRRRAAEAEAERLASSARDAGYAAGYAAGKKATAIERGPFSLTGGAPLRRATPTRPNTVVELRTGDYPSGSSIGGNWSY